MPSGQQISFQPALAEMFAQHLHHPALMRQMDIVGFDALHPDPLGDLEHGIEPVRGGLVGPHDPEIPRFRVVAEDVAQELSQHARGFGLGAAGAGDIDGIMVKVRQLELALQ